MFPPASYPTPVVECTALSAGGVRLWMKDDGATHPVYGGNKVRKIEHLIREAQRRGARRILTFGATGSHHVLTTALFTRASGLRSAAVITPQPTSAHVVGTLRAAVGQGVELYAARSSLTLPFALLRARQKGDYVVPPGGSNVIGAQGYADAVQELALQIQSGALPEPDVIVTAVGSGGTCAGLLAGVARLGLRTRILGVLVVPNPLARWMVLRLARRLLATQGGASASGVSEKQLELVTRYVGPGYGSPTPEGIRAIEIAKERLGVTLDTTYTGKAFACVLDVLKGGGKANVLYWHTLSSAPLEPLLAAAPARDALPAEVLRLLG